MISAASLCLDGSLNADLHSHSTVSDGTLAPAEVASRAKRNGVALWALTDHDEVSGIEAAAVAAHEQGLPFIAGAEISVSFAQETIHVVGLGLDEHNHELLKGLDKVRSGRLERAREMGESLAKVGIEGAFEGALAYVGNPNLISRTHFARFLVEKGICRDTGDVFRKYLVEGKPGYVTHQWSTLAECISWIHSAGGIAVMAHPGRYKRLTAQEENALFDEFCALGGRGVEVVTGSHTPADAVKYNAVAKERGLFASRGSDFHDPQESRADLGALPMLPAGLDPVWKHLEPRIRY